MQKTPLQASLLVESDDAFFIKKPPIRRASESVNATYTVTLNEIPPSISPVCKHPSAPLLGSKKERTKEKEYRGFYIQNSS